MRHRGRSVASTPNWRDTRTSPSGEAWQTPPIFILVPSVIHKQEARSYWWESVVAIRIAAPGACQTQLRRCRRQAGQGEILLSNKRLSFFALGKVGCTIAASCQRLA